MKTFKDYKQLENAGWDHMNTLLDKNMPQKKKRKILFYLPFFILGAIGLTYALKFNNLNHEENHKLESAISNPVKINQGVNEIMRAQKMESDDMKKSADLIISKVNNDIVDNKTSKKSHSIKKAKEFFHQSNPKKNMVEYNLKNLTGRNANALTKISGDQSDDEIKSIISSKYETVNISMLPVLLKELQEQQIVSVLLPELINPVTTNKIEPKPSHSINYGLLAGMQYYSANKNFSYVFGSSIDFIIKNKWSVRFAPSLEIRKGNFLIFDDSNSSLDLVTNNGKLLNNQNAKTELYNLQIPLALEYKLNTYLQLSIGMKLNIPLQKEIQSSSNSYILNWDNQQSSIWKEKPLNFLALTGITYQPLQTVGISLNYSFSPSIFYRTQYEINPSSSSPGNMDPNFTIVKNLNHFSASFNYRFK